MARYELAKAKEFWEIALYGRKLTVIQGKIGSGGQSSTKAFRSERDAAMKHDDLVAEKEKQGYRHVAKVAKSLAPAMNVPSIRRHLAAGEVAVVAGQLHPAKKRDQKLWLALEPAERRALLLADDELTNEVYDLAREIETGARREESLILFDDLVVIKSWVAKEASDYGLRALLGCKKDPSFTADRARSYLSVGIRQWPKFTGLHETAAATAAELCKRGHALEEFADKVVRSNRGFTAALRKLGRLDAGTPTPRAALKRALHEDRDRFMLLGGSVVMKHLIEVIDELPDTVEAVYQKLLDEMTGAVNFGLLLAMAAALPRGEPTLLPKFKSTSASVRLYRGDLHIRGDLSFSQDLVVMGDLVVDGVIEEALLRVPRTCWSAAPVRARVSSTAGTNHAERRQGRGRGHRAHPASRALRRERREGFARRRQHVRAQGALQGSAPRRTWTERRCTGTRRTR